MPGGGRAEILPVHANHRDLTGRTDAAIGLRIDLTSEDGQRCSVGISSDTGFGEGTDETAASYKDVNIMVPHIGSVYPFDAGMENDPPKWHLGLVGTIKLLEAIKRQSDKKWAPFILISEWGEELCPYRSDICEIIHDATGLPLPYPAEYGQRIALCDRKAAPLCDAQDGRFATMWETVDGDMIRYRCEEHTHGNYLPKGAKKGRS